MSSSTRESADEFVRWFNRTNDDNVLRVFDRKDYYSVYGKKDCEYIADQFYRTKKCISHYGTSENSKIECIYIREQQFHAICKEYVHRLHKNVEVYERDDRAAEWTLKADGRITVTSLLSMRSHTQSCYQLCCVVLSIHNEIKSIGVAAVNASKCDFQIVQFIEDEQYTKLSSLLSSLGVTQCLFKCRSEKRHEAEIKKLRESLSKCNVKIVETEKDNKFWSAFLNNESQQMSVIENILDQKSQKSLIALMKNSQNIELSLIALTAIILFENLQKDRDLFNRFSLHQYKMESYMRLDHASCCALNLFPSSMGDDNHSENYSLYGVLKKCKSSMGDRLLSVWMRQPLVDVQQIYRRQKLVKLFVENTEQREVLRNDHFKCMMDLDRLRSKLLNGRNVKLRELVDLYRFAERVQWIKNVLTEMNEVEFKEPQQDDEDEDDDIPVAAKSTSTPLTILRDEFIDPMQRVQQNFNNYLAMIEQVVDLETGGRRDYLINHEFDAMLDKLSKKQQKVYKAMEKCLARALSELGADEKKVKLSRHKSHGYCLRATKDGRTALRKNNHRFDTIQNQNNCTYFTDGGLRSLSREYIEYEKQYAERQKIVIDKTVEITKTYLPVIEDSIELFSELDVLMALAHMASTSTTKYVLPTVFPNNNPGMKKRIIMKNARHPCLELVHEQENGSDVIPNDVELVDSESRFLIITGPNMGGKSTYIRMIGMIALMAQIGSYVPCDECELTVIDAILSRVGAGDNQLRGVSTFMAEMLESSYILEAATPNSLIIVDELGRGTSTYDGYGIAYAISEHIIQSLHSFALFATHFHELSVLSTKYKDAKNRHVTADIDDASDSLAMAYKIRPGACSESFGIHVAKLAKFPNSVIGTAQRKVQQLEAAKNCKLQLATYEQMKQLLAKYEDIKQRVQSDGDAEKSIKELRDAIEAEMDANKELDQFGLAVKAKLGLSDADANNDNDNQNEKGGDKMQLDD